MDQIRFTPEELQALAQEGQLGALSHDDIAKLHPQDRAVYTDALIKAQPRQGADMLPPQLTSIAAKGLPSGESVVGAAKTAWKSPVVQGGMLYGASKIPQLPAPLREILSMMGMMKGLGGAAGEGGALAEETGAAKAATEPAMADAEYESIAGHPRYGSPGAPTTLRQPSKPSIGGVDTAGLRDQPNVSTTRTPADVKEQVSRGVGSTGGGWEDSRSTPLEYGPGSDAEVAQVQSKIKSQLKKPRGK